jgi:hypothetical protein
MFRQLRILFLLLVLFGVAMNAWLGKLRATDWEEPLWVVVYPINGDGSRTAADTVAALSDADFEDINEYFVDQARHWGRNLRKPLVIKRGPAVPEVPPAPPAEPGPFSVGLWSLRFRIWAATHDDYAGPPPDIRVFVLYHEPIENRALNHSLGLEKGRIGVVNAFATRRMRDQNNIVIAHELLHTLGATDKYDMSTNQPIFPVGYAQPDADPLLPQRRAEIMAGRTPLSRTDSRMPRNLRECVIGEQTAREIRWVN